MELDHERLMVVGMVELRVVLEELFPRRDVPARPGGVVAAFVAAEIGREAVVEETLVVEAHPPVAEIALVDPAVMTQEGLLDRRQLRELVPAEPQVEAIAKPP